MRHLARWVVGLVILAGVVAGGFHAARDPEHGPLDETARAGAGGSFVTLSDGVTHYELTGADSSAPVVVLVHGFSVPYYIWDSTVTPLRSAGFRVLRYDLFGRGYSDRPDVRYDAALFTRQLTELLDSLRIGGPVHLAGVSMGGWVTSSFIAAHPERVRSLALFDPVAVPPTVPRSLRTPWVGPYLWQTTAMPTMAAGQAGDFVHPERFPDWERRYLPQMSFDGFGRALLATRVALSEANYDSLYRRVAATGMPVLLVWGREDTSVPFAASDTVRMAMPGATFVPVDDAGHLPMIEKASVVNPVLLRFLTDTVRP